jgi:diaminohydroxyphosphoribosylaminopyrimidine deaminase / 5-amino-6-(5-phosphoribosylamino)uracil reductase
MSITISDSQHMARALRLAERGLYTATPNPRVGCVIVNDGQVVGEGWHYKVGEDHAEVIAMKAAGDKCKGATAYVSLEPCNHQGKTGPCTEALVKTGIARVVFGHEDLNPEVSGSGIKRLREAGLEVDGPLMEREARALNPGFNKRMATGLPYVRVKMAVSLDGRTAMPDNNSFWITGPKARADVQRLRAQSCAVITGWKTVEQDQASLTVRPEEFGLEPKLAERQPLRVLIDSHNQLDANAKFFRAKSTVMVANLDVDSLDGHIERKCFPEKDGHVNLGVLLAELAGRGCNELLVEAGAGLAGAFFRQGLVDEMVIYMAPKMMGSQARGMFDLSLSIMDEALPLRFIDVRTIGRDIKIVAVPELE